MGIITSFFCKSRNSIEHVLYNRSRFYVIAHFLLSYISNLFSILNHTYPKFNSVLFQCLLLQFMFFIQKMFAQTTALKKYLESGCVNNNFFIKFKN